MTLSSHLRRVSKEELKQLSYSKSVQKRIAAQTVAESMPKALKKGHRVSLYHEGTRRWYLVMVLREQTYEEATGDGAV